MPTIVSRLFACAALTLTVATASAQADMQPDPARHGTSWSGVWTNGNNTMHVRAQRCGDAMCGTVIWADDKTKADIAARGRTLLGTEVFREFRQTGPNEWRGKVYVPAIDQTVSGRIELTDPDHITASGCALFGLGCQTRHWKRIR
ncbi:MAG: DUF2147 domain-containing protein [Sphingomonas sp.]|uniref:DUF2147 domain-containing protein n=1 Tax=Sphingomonas sp. TaxID=28214 RepID=UPI003F7E6618